uniref:Uncharacterized protein n=1 Tax=Anguilla anguilla TaxID=7936 RepID=A0A0E9QA83_ANGAN
MPSASVMYMGKM